MSKTRSDQNRLYNELRREQRKKSRRPDHITELKEKRTKNALRSNNLEDLVSFDDYLSSH
jgi:hypothetical protein